MSKTDKQKWEKHYSSCTDDISLPCEVLFEYQHLLPEQGVALDLACGRGANALCLAKHGLSVSAWDISAAALEHLVQLAQNNNLTIRVEERDVISKPPEPDTFDIIVISHFLERKLIPDIRNSVKPGGMIFYQTFIKEKSNNTGPTNPDYLQDQNELLIFFKDWRIIIYREEGNIGNTTKGFRNQAMLIARKPL